MYCPFMHSDAAKVISFTSLYLGIPRITKKENPVIFGDVQTNIYQEKSLPCGSNTRNSSLTDVSRTLQKFAIYATYALYI